MDTTHSHMPVRSDRNAVRTAFFLVAILWLATGASASFSGFAGDDDWEVPYALFSVLLLMAAVATTMLIIRYTSTPGRLSARRIAAGALAVLGAVSTIVAWAFVVWEVLLAAGFLALAATGPPQGRRAGWLAGALLAGLAVAVFAASARLGPGGEHNDYYRAQSWGVTLSCALAATVLAVLAKTSEAETPVPSASHA